MTEIASLLRNIVDRFSAAGLDSPAAEAELLLAAQLGTSRGGVHAAVILDKRLDDEQCRALESQVQRRLQREPLQHILGTAPFMDFEVAVGRGVFVPRPETEQVVAAACEFFEQTCPDAAAESLRALDICAGSGVIAIALARRYPRAEVVAIEKEAAALAYTRRNTEALGDGRVQVLAADLRDLDPHTDPQLRDGFSLIISNPPYVPESERPTQPETREHDPVSALYSGADGLDLIRYIAQFAYALARPGAVLAIEHTETQGGAVAELLRQAGWEQTREISDLAGRPRATLARRPVA